MPHHTPLIATLVAGLVLAFVLGALAHRVRASPIVGYLLAGVLVGPYTPGFVADPAMAAELAEIGVISASERNGSIIGSSCHNGWFCHSAVGPRVKPCCEANH